MLISDHRPLPLEWVRAFEAAGRLGSFVAAAQALGITQAAVSQRIANLEARLSVRLFLRKPRGVALTVEGETWLPQVSLHLRAIQQSAEDLFGHAPRRVTLSASASVIQGWLAPRLAQVRPQDRVSFSFSTMVLEEEFEAKSGIQIRYGTGAWPGYRAARLFDEVIAPVAHPDLIHSDRRTIPRITLSGPRMGWADWPAFTGPQQLRFDSFAAALAASEAGAGVLLASLPLAVAALNAGRVQRLDVPSHPSPASYWLLAQPDACSEAVWRILTRLFCEGTDYNVSTVT